jgi:pimeloyl-ACP methyl ester carboxylesterase
MAHHLIKEKDYNYIEVGEGTPLIVLHGLMGGLSNFDAVTDYFSTKGYKVIIPELPLYSMTLLKTNVKSFAQYLHDFIEFKGFDQVVLLGNSLGGHIALYHTKLYPKKIKALVLTGSSGLYESAMGGGYTKRGDYEVIKKKAQEVFYDPAIATKAIVDDVYATVNDRNKLIKTLAIAKSAIRHNMSKDLPGITHPVCIIWGLNDTVTPPAVGKEFNQLLPNSELFWIDKCGHASMMERPEEFNHIMNEWMIKNKI